MVGLAVPLSRPSGLHHYLGELLEEQKRKKKALKKKGSKVMSLQITARKTKNATYRDMPQSEPPTVSAEKPGVETSWKESPVSGFVLALFGSDSEFGQWIAGQPFNACRVGEATNPGPVSDSDNALATSLLAVLEQFQRSTFWV